MKKNNIPFILFVLIYVAGLCFSSCYKDSPEREINLTFNNNSINAFEGLYDMAQVRIYCSAPEIVRLNADEIGECVREYCHSGSVLDIKQFNIPGNFEYTIEPPAPFMSDEIKYFENYDEFYSEWGFSNGNLATFFPISREIGTSCWIILEWEKQNI